MTADQILTVEQMRAAEQALMDAGTSVDALMQVAGRGAADWVWRMAGKGRVTVQVKRILNGYRLSYRGVVLEAHVYTAREAELAKLMPEKVAADTSKKLLCPMPGLVIAIPAVVGQEVKAGEPLAIVEAMKMENILRAERDVTVKSINAKKGDSLAVDAVIMEFA